MTARPLKPEEAARPCVLCGGTGWAHLRARARLGMQFVPVIDAEGGPASHRPLVIRVRCLHEPQPEEA